MHMWQDKPAHRIHSGSAGLRYRPAVPGVGVALFQVPEKIRQGKYPAVPFERLFCRRVQLSHFP